LLPLIAVEQLEFDQQRRTVGSNNAQHLTDRHMLVHHDSEIPVHRLERRYGLDSKLGWHEREQCFEAQLRQHRLARQVPRRRHSWMDLAEPAVGYTVAVQDVGGSARMEMRARIKEIRLIARSSRAEPPMQRFDQALED